MAEIMGFRGIRYNADRAGASLTALVAPPYDIISPAQQEVLYAQSPYNVVRLILGLEDDKYQSAANCFRQWLADGVLIKEDSEAVYVCRQSFQDPSTGNACPERVALVCLLKLEEYETGMVLPHENTLTGAKADRLALMRATDAQFEPIFGLFSDPDMAVQSFLGEYDDRETAMETVPDAIGSSHTVERLRDEDALCTLQNLMRDKPIFIADGHHRYETALKYRREVRAAQNVPPDAFIPEDYILIALTAFEDEGLLVLPTHRLVTGADPSRIAALPELLSDEFTFEPLPENGWERALAAKAAEGHVVFGMLLPEGRSILATQIGSGQKSDETKVVRTVPERLPISILHSRILEDKLGIGADALASGHQVTYTRDGGEAWAKVQRGEAQAAFLLTRPAVGEVRDISLAGDKMPQKSTFFFPKLLSGLLLRDLRIS